MRNFITKLLKLDSTDDKYIDRTTDTTDIIDNIEINPEPQISWKNKSDREKENICFDLYVKIKEQKYDQNKIKLLVEKYTDDILFETIKTYIGESHIRYNILFVLPKNTQNLIFLLTEGHIDIGSIEEMSNKIDINFIGDNNETCLFHISDITYLISILSSNKLHFNINHVNNNRHTFFTKLLVKKTKITEIQFKTIINILIKNNYDFNKIHNGQSVLDIVCLHNINLIDNIVRISNYDVTSTTLWLYTLIHSHQFDKLQSVLSIIVCRPDYKSFLNKIINSYFYASADADILLIMNLIRSIDNEKLVELIMYKNTDGNTVLHVAAIYHFDRIIQFILLSVKINLKFDKNIDDKTTGCSGPSGKTPSELYTENSIINIL